jgi:hypothetical protein
MYFMIIFVSKLIRIFQLSDLSCHVPVGQKHGRCAKPVLFWSVLGTCMPDPFSGVVNPSCQIPHCDVYHLKSYSVFNAVATDWLLLVLIP